MRTGTPALHKQIERSAERKSPVPARKVELFPTGSTELNLACSDNWRGAFSPGVMINVIGDSFAGKTYLAYSIMAEAAISRAFKNHKLIYDNVEVAGTDEIVKMFGRSLVNKIEMPSKEGCSETIEELQANVIRAISDDPCIYVLDSYDSLSSNDETKRMNKMAAGEKIDKGSYKMEQAKGLKHLLRNSMRRLEKTGSLLIIVSQTIHNVGSMGYEPDTRAGGRALKFFASFEIWLHLREKIKKMASGRTRVVGSRTHIKVTKNKLTGKYREANFSIYQDYGIDDVGSCVDFLVDEKFWPKSKNTISWPEQDLTGSRDKLIDVIEDEGLQERLRHTVGRAWLHIEDSIRTNRKPKYK